MDDFKPEKFRIWYVHQVGGGEAFERNVPDPETGQLILDAIYDLMLKMFDDRMIPDYCNTGGIVYLDEDGDWVDYHAEDWAVSV